MCGLQTSLLQQLLTLQPWLKKTYGAIAGLQPLTAIRYTPLIITPSSLCQCQRLTGLCKCIHHHLITAVTTCQRTAWPPLYLQVFCEGGSTLSNHWDKVKLEWSPWGNWIASGADTRINTRTNENSVSLNRLDIITGLSACTNKTQ